MSVDQTLKEMLQSGRISAKKPFVADDHCKGGVEYSNHGVQDWLVCQNCRVVAPPELWHAKIPATCPICLRPARWKVIDADDPDFPTAFEYRHLNVCYAECGENQTIKLVSSGTACCKECDSSPKDVRRDLANALYGEASREYDHARGEPASWAEYMARVRAEVEHEQHNRKETTIHHVSITREEHESKDPEVRRKMRACPECGRQFTIEQLERMRENEATTGNEDGVTIALQHGLSVKLKACQHELMEPVDGTVWQCYECKEFLTWDEIPDTSRIGFKKDEQDNEDDTQDDTQDVPEARKLFFASNGSESILREKQVGEYSLGLYKAEKGVGNPDTGLARRNGFVRFAITPEPNRVLHDSLEFGRYFVRVYNEEKCEDYVGESTKDFDAIDTPEKARALLLGERWRN